jgi:hypothetical protein
MAFGKQVHSVCIVRKNIFTGHESAKRGAPLKQERKDLRVFSADLTCRSSESSLYAWSTLGQLGVSGSPSARASEPRCTPVPGSQKLAGYTCSGSVPSCAASAGSEKMMSAEQPNFAAFSALLPLKVNAIVFKISPDSD